MKSNMSLFQKIREIAVLIRIQQLGTSVTAIIGALTVKGAELGLTNLLLLFLIGVIINIGGQIHNDIMDFEIDKRSKELKKRPFVKGTVSMKTGKIIILVCLVAVIALLLVYIPNIYAISILFASFAFGALYNIFSKKLPGADLFLSVSMALLLIFGAISVTDNFQGLQDIGLLTWIIAMITFIHVFLMDALGGGLKDAKNDREAGAKTLAVYLGVKADKKLDIPLSYIIIILFSEIITAILVLITIFITDIEYSNIHIAILILFVTLLLFSSIKMLSMKIFDRKKIIYYNRYHELAGYILIPVIIFESIGIFWVVFLVAFPIVWFVIFNFFLYNESWFDPKTYG